MITPARELDIRTFLKTKAEAALSGMIVFRTRKLFASPQDFATRTSQTYSSTFKIKYLMISFASFKDSPTKGCDDDPNTYLTYALQLYRDSQEEKTTGSNSHDLLVNDTLLLRTAFLEDRVIEANKLEHEALIQVGEMVKVQPCEHVVGGLGDWLNFRLTVEVNS